MSTTSPAIHMPKAVQSSPPRTLDWTLECLSCLRWLEHFLSSGPMISPLFFPILFLLSIIFPASPFAPQAAVRQQNAMA